MSAPTGYGHDQTVAPSLCRRFVDGFVKGKSTPLSAGATGVAVGVGATVLAAALALGHGLYTPPVEEHSVIISRTRETSKVETKKRKALDTYQRATPVFLTDSKTGKITLGGYAFESGSRERTDEETKSETNRDTSTTTKTTTRPVLPDWSAGVMVGGQFAGKPALTIPGAPALVLGISGGFRVPLDKLGVPPSTQVWLEGWLLTSGQAGGQIRGLFP